MNSDNPKSDEIIDLQEALDILGVSRTTFYRWMKEEKIRGRKAGGQWRFYRDDIYRILEEPHPEKDEVITKSLNESIGLYTKMFAAIDIHHDQLLGLMPLHPVDISEALKTDSPSPNPARRLFDLMLIKAVIEEASDIHIEPCGSSTRVRHRDTGTLFKVVDLPGEILPVLAREIKVLSGCNPGQIRSAQNGSFSTHVGNREVLCKISFFPSIEGEAVEVRILDKSISIPPVRELDMNPKDLEKLIKSINASSGLVIFTGPSGCGKTTALYSCLQEINTERRNILTVEDHVEISLEGINQSQIMPDKGYTFLEAARQMLRHDPDVLVIGEIRDPEVMNVAMEGSITGRLVFTLLHATDATAAIQRLLDIGIEPFMINDTVTLIISPRVVRKICEHCKEEIQSDRNMAHKLSYGSHHVKNTTCRGKGCTHCHGSGYKGRTALYEVLPFSEDLNRIVLSRAPLSDMRKAIHDLGINTLKSEAIRKVNEGVTTLEEVFTVLDPGGKWR